MKNIINLLTTEKDVASGQHTPAGEVMWSYSNAADDVEKKNIEKEFINELGNSIKIEIKEIKNIDSKSKKEFDGVSVIITGPDSTSENIITINEANYLTKALNEFFGIRKMAIGLTDIPTSTNGGEILNFQGIPYDNLKNNEDDEIVDFFGAKSKIDEIPPGNESEKNIISQRNRMNSIIKNIKDGGIHSGVSMKRKARLEKLQKMFKIAGPVGGIIGSTVGATAFNFLPMINLLPAPIRIILGGAGGSLLEEFLKKEPQTRAKIEQQSNNLIDLQTKLKTYGVNDDEINKLATGRIKPEQLPDIIIARKGKLPFAWKEPLKKLAETYVQSVGNLTTSLEMVQKQVVPEPQPKNSNMNQESFNQEQRVRTPQAYSGKRLIKRPGDPYTYSKNPSGDGYIVVSAPPNKNHIIGRVIKPGSPGFTAIQAADLEISREERAPLFTSAEKLIHEAQQKQDMGLFREAAELYKQSYDKQPESNSLFNAAKAYYDAGMPSISLDLFTEYKEKYPDEWNKNLSKIPDLIKNKFNIPLEEPVIETQPEEVVNNNMVVKENIQQSLEKFLQGVPIRVQTNEGTTTTMDSDRVRKLTNRYIMDISGSKNLTDGLGLTTTGIIEDFGSQINDGILKAKEKGATDEELKGIFNGLVWQALRRAWAKWRGKSPTEKQQMRRLKRIEKQDERMLNDAEKVLRRENAKRQARLYLIEQIYKTAK